MLVYNRVLTQSERLQVINYLKTKWNFDSLFDSANYQKNYVELDNWYYAWPGNVQAGNSNAFSAFISGTTGFYGFQTNRGWTRPGPFTYVFPNNFGPILSAGYPYKGAATGPNPQGISGYTITSATTITTDCNYTSYFDITGFTDASSWIQKYNFQPQMSFCTPTATPSNTPTVTPTRTIPVTPTRTPTANKIYRAFCSSVGTCGSGVISYVTPGGLIGSRPYTGAEIDAGFLLPCAQNYPNPPVKSSGLGTVLFTIFSSC